MTTINSTTPSTESHLRRALARRGYRLSKIRENSRHFHPYGPYMVIDSHTNGSADYGMDLDGVRAWVADLDAEQEGDR